MINFSWNKATREFLETVSDKVAYAVARQILDRAYTGIPKDTGEMRQTSTAAGVRGSNANYYVGSYTSYAKEVWNYPDNTNWSEPGTNNKWYERTWKKSGKNILKVSVERSKKSG